MMKISILLFIGITCNLAAFSQSPKEVSTRMLEAISGKAEEKRDWEQFRKLFIADAHFTAVHETSNGEKLARTLNLEEFVRSFQQQTAKGDFEEKEITSKVDEFNGIAQVFQVYEVIAGDYAAKGINSIQLVQHKGKWLIASVIWSNETGNEKVPDSF